MVTHDSQDSHPPSLGRSPTISRTATQHTQDCQNNPYNKCPHPQGADHSQEGHPLSSGQSPTILMTVIYNPQEGHSTSKMEMCNLVGFIID